MGLTTLYHPVDIPLIRHCLTKRKLIVGKFAQVKVDPLGSWALYDVTIKDTDFPIINELLTPREVKQSVQKALDSHDVGLGWYGTCKAVSFRNDHWCARIEVGLLQEVAK